MKKEIILNNQIIRDLSQNSVQNNDEEFILGYDKILDEKLFYEKTIRDYGSHNNYTAYTVKSYIEILTYLYDFYLKNVYWKCVGNLSISKEFNLFLKIKNELKYVSSIYDNGEVVFGNLFNSKGLDIYDLKRYSKNRKINFFKIKEYIKSKSIESIDEKTANEIVDTLIHIPKLMDFSNHKDFVDNIEKKKVFSILKEDENVKKLRDSIIEKIDSNDLFDLFEYFENKKMFDLFYDKEIEQKCLEYINKFNSSDSDRFFLAEVIINNNINFWGLIKDQYIEELILLKCKGEGLEKIYNGLPRLLLIKKVRKDILEKLTEKEILKKFENLLFYEDRLFFDFINIKDIIALVNIKEFEKHIKNTIFGKYLKLNNSPYESKINSFIKNSDSGSFLLSGYRGVGKTSLLKKSFNDFNKNNDEQVIPVFVNIPESDENNKFSKKQLMNFIIRNLYKEILLNPGKFPKNFERKLEDQYIRTFKDVKNIEGELIVKKRGILRVILAILQYGLPFGLGLLIFIFGKNIFEFIKNIFGEEYKIIFENLYKNFGLIQLIIAFLVFIIGYKISFSFINVTFKSKIAQDLYDENIAEQKLTDNLGSYNDYLDTIWFTVGNYFFSKHYSEVAYSINNTLVFLLFSPLIFLFLFLGSLIFVAGLIYLLTSIAQFLYFLFKIIPFGLGEYLISFFEKFYYGGLSGFFLYLIIFWFILGGLGLFFKKYFSRPKHKFVIVIDELDKLLDFEKNKNGSEKGKMNINGIFDILGKLKILFFDTKGLLFFVVTNKDAYDYHLVNKYQEDDLVSNIFNRILYLPMNEKEKFNLNFSVLGNEKKENKNLSSEEIILLKNKFSSEELYNFNNWLYFKSHGNWRKMRFILNEKLDNNGEKNILKINLDEINFENKFYSFFEKIYYLFQIKTLEKIDNGNPLYEFLIGIQGEKKESNKKGLLIEFIEGNFYKNYLLNIGDIVEKISVQNEKISEKNNINIILDYLKNNIGKNSDNSSDALFKNIGFFIASIEKISDEMAFRDYIINNLLNFYEALKFNKKIDFEILLNKIQITKDDLNYPAFEDFILYWIPFMLYYFGEKGLINKDELEKLFILTKKEKNKDISEKNKDISEENNILKIYSQKEENILIDVFLNQSINNLNSEGGFNLNFDEIKNDENEYKKWRDFIETKLNISFGIMKNEKEINDDVFGFWKNKIIGSFLKNKKLELLNIDNFTKRKMFKYYKNSFTFKDFPGKKVLYSNILKKLIDRDNHYEYLYFHFGLIYNLEKNNIFETEEIKDSFYFKTVFSEDGFEKVFLNRINKTDDIKIIKEEWFNII